MLGCRRETSFIYWEEYIREREVKIIDEYSKVFFFSTCIYSLNSIYHVFVFELFCLCFEVVLGDIPYKVLDYRIAVEQSMGETWNYFQRTTRKERKMGDYPGASRLIVGTEPVQHVYNWVQTNAKKVAAQERQTYNFAEKVALEHNVGKSFLENTSKFDFKVYSKP